MEIYQQRRQYCLYFGIIMLVKRRLVTDEDENMRVSEMK